MPEDGGATVWMPPQSSTIAGEVDWLFNFILGISVVFFVLIVVVMMVFVVKYRRREGRETASPSASNSVFLEMAWMAISIVVVVIIFFFGFKSYLNISTPPANAYEIQVAGQKWDWSFTYPNGYVDQDLHVPADRPVELVMTSVDVIHSFYVPAFRVKKDVVPGRYTNVWFEATKPGEYNIFCAEYCGTGHSDSSTMVIVHPSGEFGPWLEKASNFLLTMTPEEGGRKVYEIRGCQQCHSVDGSPRTGPTFFKVFGKEETLADGSIITVDEDYIRESVLEPNAKVVAGFEPVMPTYQGRMKDDQIEALIAYIKSLDGKTGEE
ncbi:MAG: cytochrome c oxidase subunit II [Acidobacteria bacterium]|nr:MAG: cytochrome c oxidase subunit II [Acidobacteriota bacterium]